MANKKNSKGEPIAKKVKLREGPYERLCIAALAVYILGRLFCAYLPHESFRIWGIDFAGYSFPGIDIYFALLLPIPFLLKSVRSRAAKLIASFTSSRGILSSSYVLIPGIIGLIIFYAYHRPVLFPFLGDGAYYQTEIFRIISDPLYSSSLVKATSFLTGFVLEWLTRLVMPESAATPYLITGFVSCALMIGGVFVLIPRALSGLRFLSLAFVLTSGAILFFFGYTELYALQYACAFLFVLSLLRSLNSDGSIVLPAVFLTLSILFGGSSLLFVPAYLYFVITKSKRFKEKQGIVLFWLFIALSLAAIIGLYLFAGDEIRQHYLTPIFSMQLTGPSFKFEGSYSYGVLSGERLLDMVNVLLLNGTVFIVLLPILVIIAIKQKLFDAATRIFVLMAVSGFIALCFAMSSFALMRDWDFASIPTLGITALGLYFLHVFDQKKLLDLRNLLPVLLAAGITFSYLWVNVNASEASVQRFEDAVSRDASLLPPHASFTALENLRKYYSGTGNIPQKHKTLKKIIVNDYRSWEAFEELLWDTATLENAPEQLEQFAWILDVLYKKAQAPVNEDHYNYIAPERIDEIMAAAVYVAVKYGNAVDLAARYVRLMHEQHPDWREYSFLRIAVLNEKQSGKDEIDLQESVRSDADEPILTMAMGDYLYKSGLMLAAIPYYERTLELAPSKYPDVYFSLARALEESSGSIEKSIIVLERFLEHCKFDSRVAQVRSLVNMQKEMRQ